MRPPDSWRSARVTLALALVTFAAWFLAWGGGLLDLAAFSIGFIPARWQGFLAGEPVAPFVLTPLTATLAHAGWIHVGFNLLILVFCGRPVEALLGARGMILLYVVGAYAAAGAHWLVNIGSPVPMVGASGAVSAVIGAYALMFGRNKVKVAHPMLALGLHALWLAGAWVVLQLLVGYTFQAAGARIAIAAHIGGFLVGLALAKPLLLLRWRGA